MFADILNRVRVGQQTEDGIQTLNTRVVPDQIDCLHIYPTNNQVNTHNDQQL